MKLNFHALVKKTIDSLFRTVQKCAFIKILKLKALNGIYVSYQVHLEECSTLDKLPVQNKITIENGDSAKI